MWNKLLRFLRIRRWDDTYFLLGYPDPIIYYKPVAWEQAVDKYWPSVQKSLREANDTLRSK